MHRQGCGKLRLMDSGELPGHNSATWEFEMISTATVDFIPAMMARVFELAACNFWKFDDEMGPWYLQPPEGLEPALPACSNTVAAKYRSLVEAPSSGDFCADREGGRLSQVRGR